MSEKFYSILFFSLLLTVGVLLLFYVYRMFLRSMKSKTERISYSVLHNIDRVPVSGEGGIRFDLGEDHPVELVVLDENENTMMMLVKENKTKGSWHVYFDSKQLPNGNYFYRLTTSNQTITKRMRIFNP